VLVTDLRMPQIDGITVARLARTHSPAMPILIVTAYPDLARRLDGADPMPQIFIKPLDYPALVGALRALPGSCLTCIRLPDSETRFAELKRYVAFSAGDAALLAGFRDTAAPHFERIAQEFYDQIRLHEEAHAVFTGEAQIARLQRSLVRWLERVFGGTYDEAYFAETTAIGRVHVKVGLPQRYMFTAMALIRLSLMDLAEASGPRGIRVARAICRLLDLELAIMLESYRDDSIARIQHAERLEKEALGRDLAQTQHRYVNAVELARVLIVGLDDAGTVKLWNREAERVTGFAATRRSVEVLLTVLGVDPDGEGARSASCSRSFAAARPERARERRPPLEMAICTRPAIPA
jgi:CheY-like chemotaxis protein